MNNTRCNGNQGAQGGCIAANNATQLAIVNTQMLSNTAANGGGIYVSGCAELVVYNVTMRNNSATVNGGGIFQVGPQLLIWTASLCCKCMPVLVCLSGCTCLLLDIRLPLLQHHLLTLVAGPDLMLGSLVMYT